MKIFSVLRNESGLVSLCKAGTNVAVQIVETYKHVINRSLGRLGEVGTWKVKGKTCNVKKMRKIRGKPSCHRARRIVDLFLRNFGRTALAISATIALEERKRTFSFVIFIR
jgi:hypothetical protein